MIIFSIIVVLIYSAVMLFYTSKFKSFSTEDTKFVKPQTYFSILIPFRNEAENLPQLLKSLSALNYPKNLFKIYLVNDHSEDDSKAICLKYIEKLDLKNTLVLDNKNLATSPKKSAILTALEQIKSGYVITTDADCLLPEHWLLHFDHCIQKTKAQLIAGSVRIAEENTFWQKFQVLDLMSLQVIGLGSFKTKNALMCNAANLAYNVKTLKELNAFDQHQQHISGDDIFTLQAFQNAGKTIKALVHPNTVVWTKAEQNFKDLTQQRIRWASKAKHYQNNTLIGLGVLVFLTNLILVVSLGFTLVFESFRNWFWLLWVLKLITDFMVLKTGNQFFKTSLCARDYLLLLLVYPFVSVYFAVLSFGGKFNWKDRHYKI
ncbi:glycosyltransferase [Flavobacterium sp. CS20]|uniref:glycosyltransferase n=1 Tax=Flavobacterium sp. CS20 TaxID=2775246 RepID=UPI001B3A2224|nr:glycosyltransferase [Flavobacterium sp. CS20]QTY26052.1 glycosyltransferase [Flavobacterium sp. CS20]